jgi:hypothetical protein
MKFKFAILLLILGSCNSLYAWENRITHPALTNEAVGGSSIDSYLKTQTGLTDGIIS